MKTFIDCTELDKLHAAKVKAVALYNDLYELGYYATCEDIERAINSIDSEINWKEEDIEIVIDLSDENISTGRHP